MLGWLIRIVGILIMLTHDNAVVAVICILALVVATMLDEDSVLRWFIGKLVLIVALSALFKVSFWLGVIMLIICLLSALTPGPAPPQHRLRNF